MKIFRIKDVATLKRTYPYQFAEQIEWSVPRGWLPLVVGACQEIDARLGDDREKFHWLQIRQKFGTLRLHCLVDTERQDLKKMVAGIIYAAERKANQSCMVCGRYTRLHSFGGRLITLCKRHSPDGSGLPMSQYFAALPGLLYVPEGAEIPEASAEQGNVK